MRLYRLLVIIALIAVPFWGMAYDNVDDNVDENEDGNWSYIESQIYSDSASQRFSIEYERENDSYIYIDSLHPGEEYIYVTEYEEEKHIWDRVITRLLKTSVDTNYITTNDYGLQVKVDFNTFNSQSNFRWDASSDTLPNFCRITSDKINKIGLWIYYRNFGLGGSLNLKTFNKHKTEYNTDLNFGYYGDAWGVDLGAILTRGNNLYFNRIKTDVSSADIKTFRIQINSYYAPFYKRFSYNAAFSHSMRQEKSAGSPLFGLSLHTFYMNANPAEFPKIIEDEDFILPSEISYASMDLSAGYAHNFVTKKKTLLHISVLPYITLLKRTDMKPSNMTLREPRVQNGGIGRVSWIWQREHHLISVFGSIIYSNILSSPIKVSDMIYRVGTCYGFRAYKHHKPHKKRRILKRRASTMKT